VNEYCDIFVLAVNSTYSFITSEQMLQSSIRWHDRLNDVILCACYCSGIWSQSRTNITYSSSTSSGSCFTTSRPVDSVSWRLWGIRSLTETCYSACHSWTRWRYDLPSCTAPQLWFMAVTPLFCL